MYKNRPKSRLIAQCLIKIVIFTICMILLVYLLRISGNGNGFDTYDYPVLFSILIMGYWNAYKWYKRELHKLNGTKGS